MLPKKTLVDSKKYTEELVALFREGKFEEAVLRAARQIHSAEIRFGPDDLIVLEALQGLQWLYTASGRYEAAAPIYQRIYQITEKHFGEKHPQALNALNDIGKLAILAGDFSAAETAFKKNLEFLQKKNGKDNRRAAETLSYLGKLYETQGDPPSAEKYYQRALKIFKSKAPWHPAKMLVEASLKQLSAKPFSPSQPKLEKKVRVPVERPKSKEDLTGELFPQNG